MRRAVFLLGIMTLAVGLVGCCGPHSQCGTSWLCGSCTNCPETCASCSDGGCDSCGGAGCQSCGQANAGLGGLMGMDAAPCDPGGRACRGRGYEAFDPGPPTGAVTYPYYTNRGPRDFLARSPQSIGP